MEHRYVHYRIDLNAPLLLPGSEADPNSVRSLGYLRGVEVRGGLAGTVDSNEFDRIILSGAVTFLNAHLAVEKKRSLPVPLSYRQVKNENEVFDLQADPDRSGGVRVGFAFATLDQAGPKIARPAFLRRVHHLRDRKRPGTDADGNTVFTNEALDRNQSLRGVLLLRAENSQELDALRNQVETALRRVTGFGRSRKATYGGRPTIEVDKASVQRECMGREGVWDQGKAIASGQRFRVLLVSDYIGRDPLTGQVDPARLQMELQERLGNNPKLISAHVGEAVVGGYNRKWGMPLPQAPAARAGSVLLFEAAGEIPADVWQAIELDGLGERRIDGFGRVLFLGEPLDHISITPAARERAKKPDGALPVSLHAIQRRIVARRLEQSLLRQARLLARSVSADDLPSPSLVGRLRHLVRTGANLNDLRSPAKRQLDACRIGEEKNPLVDWIAGLADKAALEAAVDWATVKRKSKIGDEAGVDAAMLPEDWQRIRLGFIDTVLAQLARRRRLASRNEEQRHDG